jgi:hypothetical protein
MTKSEFAYGNYGRFGIDEIVSSSLTAPQAFYVDVPAQSFANEQVSTYDF